MKKKLNYLSSYICYNLKMDISFLSSYPADYYYLGFGSAFCREDVPGNMQQFPPFMQRLHREGKEVTVINVDPVFEDPPYLVAKMNMTPVASTIPNVRAYSCDRLFAVYVTHSIDGCVSSSSDDLTSIKQLVLNVILNDKLIFGAFYEGSFSASYEMALNEYFVEMNMRQEFMTRAHFNYIYELSACFVNVEDFEPVIVDNMILKVDGSDEDEILAKCFHCEFHDKFMKQVRSYVHMQMYGFLTHDLAAVRSRLLDYEGARRVLFLPQDYMTKDIRDLKQLVENRINKWSSLLQALPGCVEIVQAITDLLKQDIGENPYTWINQYSRMLRLFGIET